MDFLAECEALDAFVSRYGEADFARRTDFYGWTVRDEVMHLYFLDLTTLKAIEQEADFLAEVADIRRCQAAGGELSDYMRERYRALTRDTLLEAWRETYRRLAQVFAAADPKGRMKWFGPDMSLRSAASARQMEVWAHGQDIYDLFGVERVPSDRVRNICEIGVRTQGWTFHNRKLDTPEAPTVTLTAPSGGLWRWNEGGAEAVEGPAADFALVVTQRRHVDDTALRVTGPGARRWMELAQCFAGAPSDGPPPKRARTEA
ncbi:TIGR03084 family metal-binding protein [Phenylobacterium sp.]|uniref:TIGR03084 family metal-binding protein n=1 Tax=Phenylobacterium sp. TaxID=1871053 RepID=UPI002F40237B